MRPFDRCRTALGLAAGILLLTNAASAAGQDALKAPSAAPRYQYTTTRGFLTATDGTQLAVTWWIPTPIFPGERFPALLELLPYRKDDSFYARDYPLYDYFVRRGFLLAKVDVRGTGGSSGKRPDREYSDIEQEDAVEIIRQLAADRRSNGNVGMWGISWGGFNSLQVAMRQPPALKAIIALHAADDLYHDDIRYIDGGFHIDPYTLQIDHENALPRTPDYLIDAAYFRDRFDAYPWVLTYLKQPVDGPFWRDHGLRYHPEKLVIPAYFIGGLLDGYRDTPIRALGYLTHAPVKVEMGPWVHAWPDDGTPGPNYEWRARAVEWWNHWLRGLDAPMLREPRLMLFERAGHGPGRDLMQTPGRWRFEDWPVAGATTRAYRLAPDGRLESAGTPGAPASVALSYHPGYGTIAGDWWGEPTGDMRPDDAGSLTFDSPPVDSALTLIGLPAVRIRAVAGAPLANWTARLEDVAPTGEVSLVAGGVLNATQARSSTSPARLIPGDTLDLAWDLHFTTWVYRPGHRIRLALANAQFPMIWPTPYPMVSTVVLGGQGSLLQLPVAPGTSAYPAPRLPVPEPRAERPDVTWLDSPEPVEKITFEPHSGTTTMEWRAIYAERIGKVRIDNDERERYTVATHDPAHARFDGFETHRIRPPGRDLLLETTLEIQGDSTAFHVLVRRRLSSAGRVVRVREWRESVPRQFH